MGTNRREQPNDYMSPEQQKLGHSRWYWDRRYIMPDTDEYPTLKVSAVKRARRKVPFADIVIMICFIILCWLFIILFFVAMIAVSNGG